MQDKYGYEIIYSKQATKFLEKRTQKERFIIEDAILNLPNGNVVKMKNSQSYRLKVQDFRIIFSRNKEQLHIEIAKIDNRGQVYK
jgi:mRNA interferase RelE/StbE